MKMLSKFANIFFIDTLSIFGYDYIYMPLERLISRESAMKRSTAVVVVVPESAARGQGRRGHHRLVIDRIRLGSRNRLDQIMYKSLE